MTPTEAATWSAALRSGEFKQFRGNYMDDYDRPTEFCCLTVGAIVLGHFDLEDTTRRHIGITSCVGKLKINGGGMGQFIHMNDTQGKTFEQIADYIDEHAEEL